MKKFLKFKVFGMSVIIIALTFSVVRYALKIYLGTPLISVTDELVGNGNAVEMGKLVEFDYQAFVSARTDKETFQQKLDSSYDRQERMKIVIGQEQFYKPIEEALVGMRVGGRRLVKVKAGKLFDNENFKKSGMNPALTSESILVYILEVKGLQ